MVAVVDGMLSDAFIRRMEAELRANAHKGDWREWRPGAAEMVGELQHHVDKLKVALEHGDREGVAEYAADVANICMMIAAVEGTNEPT